MKILTLFLIIVPSVLFAQKKGFGISVFNNTIYYSELFTNGNFDIHKIKGRNPSILAGIYYVSLGKNRPFSVRHGVDVFVPLGSPRGILAPRNSYTFITNSISYSFLDSKAFKASVRSDLKFLLGKSKFERNLYKVSASRWMFGGGFAIQPLPKNNPVKLVYQVNITPAYYWRPANYNWAYHFSNLGVEFEF
jgi:hypothetical protein